MAVTRLICRTRVPSMPLVVPLLAVAAACASPEPGSTGPETVRIAMYNIHELSTTRLTHTGAAGVGLDEQARAAATVIQQVRPDILVLNEFDLALDAPEEPAKNARRFAEAYLASGDDPLTYPYAYSAATNTGELTGLDLNADGLTATEADLGTREHGYDSYGYGTYPGQYGMAVLSRFPLDSAGARTFRLFRWRDLPGHHMPPGYYSPEAEEVFRLSSKSHWDLPVVIGADTLRLWVSHPTPPSFDGPEDRNGRRNFDEIRFWVLYLEGSDTLIDDAGGRGGYASGAPFVIAGDLNAQPGNEEVMFDGVSAIDQLLHHPGIQDPPGTRANTARFLGGVRVDYVLPSAGLEVLKSCVFNPDSTADPSGAALADLASDHRLVWIDVAWPPGSGTRTGPD